MQWCQWTPRTSFIQSVTIGWIVGDLSDLRPLIRHHGPFDPHWRSCDRNLSVARSSSFIFWHSGSIFSVWYVPPFSCLPVFMSDGYACWRYLGFGALYSLALYFVSLSIMLPLDSMSSHRLIYSRSLIVHLTRQRPFRPAWINNCGIALLRSVKPKQHKVTYGIWRTHGHNHEGTQQNVFTWRFFVAHSYSDKYGDL